MKEIVDSIKLLRFPFSVFLLPVTLFSFYYIRPDPDFSTFLVIFVWHFLVYPSSNGYNSYHDRDTGPIGALANPPLPPKLLLHTCNVFDLLAVLISFCVNIYFPLFVGVYIIASRLYSYRPLRLKKFPITGFLIVFIFQGAWIFVGNILALGHPVLLFNDSVLISALACSFFVGTIYPITQVYQHKQDKEDGVMTLSMKLGIRGTFIFSGVMFLFATVLMYFSFRNQPGVFFLFNMIMLLSAVYFIGWAVFSFINPARVNFRNAMGMVLLATLCNNIFFIILLYR